jgi:hypothetical protein
VHRAHVEVHAERVRLGPVVRVGGHAAARARSGRRRGRGLAQQTPREHAAGLLCVVGGVGGSASFLSPASSGRELLVLVVVVKRGEGPEMGDAPPLKDFSQSVGCKWSDPRITLVEYVVLPGYYIYDQ